MMSSSPRTPCSRAASVSNRQVSNARGQSSRKGHPSTLSNGNVLSCVDVRTCPNASHVSAPCQLDEAHNIKERATNTAKATFELKSKYRWCLSGTPLQNRVGELYSLIRFLGCNPFSHYYCTSRALLLRPVSSSEVHCF
jgi:hypothetical protein